MIIPMNSFKEIFNRLPSSWSQVTLDDFVRYTKLPVNADAEDSSSEDIDKALRIIAAFADVEQSVLEQFTPHQLNELGKKLEFVNREPALVKTNIKVKRADELSFDDFTLYAGLVNDVYNNLPEILHAFAYREEKKLFSRNQIKKLSIEEIKSLCWPEACTIFFLQAKALRKFLNATRTSLTVKLVRQTAKELVSLAGRKMFGRRTSKT